MSEETLSARQRELVRASAAAARASRRVADRSADGPPELPQLGEVFVLAATADFPVEWALLDRREGDGPFLAVPGDSHPFLGSRDVEVETTTGFLNLRCAAGVWLEPAAFQPDLRVGALAADGLERALRKVHEVGRRGFTPDPFLEEVDLSPEYEEWMRDVVQPARAAATSPGVVRPFKPAAPAAVAAAAPSRARRFFSGWAAAAVLLFLVSSGLSVWLLRQRQELEGLTARARAAEAMSAALAAERARREEERRSAAEASREAGEREAEAGELRERIAALERRLAGPGEPVLEPILNAPVAVLQPAEVLRGGEPKAYRLPAGAPFLAMVLKFREADSYPAYRLVLTRQGEEKPAWQTDGLERSPEGVQVALPRRLLPPGTYRLSLSGLRSGAAQPVADYELRVVP